MCDAVGEVRDALAALVAELDPDAVPLPEVVSLWERSDAIERLAGAAKTLLARRVEESGTWARTGHRSPAEHLAAEAGTSLGAARAELETSHRLQALPRVEASLRQGELSKPQAEAVADAASADPDAEDRLLDTARRSSVRELREECARTKAAADPDPDATHRRIHRSRRLQEFTDADGAWNLMARGPVEAGARVRAALEPLIEEIFRAHREADQHEPREAYAFDALIELARRARDGAATEAKGRRRTNPTHLALLRADLEALVRGEVQGEELCEITGLGPIPVRVARELLGDAVLKLVITKGTDVLNVTHLGRGPSAAQRIALLWSSPTCIVKGCSRTRVEIDHRIPWSETHHTRVDESDPLCGHHHYQKTHEGWALVEGTGKRPMVGPDDPRHPKNRPRDGPEP